MQCESCRKMLIDHLVGELSAEGASQIEQHLAECPTCRAAAEEFTRILESSSPGPDFVPDDRLGQNLCTSLRGLRGRRTGTKHGIGLILAVIARPVPSYAALLLLLGATAIGFWMGQATTGPSDAALRIGASSPAIHRPPAHPPVAESLASHGLTFTYAHSDAVRLPPSVFGDSL